VKTPAPYWRDVPGTGGKYQCSRGGDVRHVWPNGKTTLLKPYLLRSECHKNCRNRLHVHMRIDGKDKVRALISVVADTWLGQPPPGMVWHHANGSLHDNRVDNIKPITRRELGLKTGARSTRKSVEMIDPAGQVVELYASARDAGRANNMSYQAVIDRCHGKVKKPYALTGYTFRYEDEPRRQGRKARP